jgi:PPOX class probable F420-dependent enzyme
MSDSLTLAEGVRAVLDSPEFATVATLLPDGSPHLSVVWVERDGDDVLFSTVVGRRKHLNLLADPRVSLLVYPKDNPYSYVEIRGVATMTQEGGRELIDRLAGKYRGLDRYPYDEGTDNVRVVIRVRPTKIVALDLSNR